MSPVINSGISKKVLINIIVASAKIARKAPCSRYAYLASVHFFTNIIVKLLTNIAPTHNHSAMTKMFLLSANAPITPSKEKLASRTSKYRNNESHIFPAFCIISFCLLSNLANHPTNTKIINPRMPAQIKLSISLLGRRFPTLIRISNVMTIHMDSRDPIFLSVFSMGFIR